VYSIHSPEEFLVFRVFLLPPAQSQFGARGEHRNRIIGSFNVHRSDRIFTVLPSLLYYCGNGTYCTATSKNNIFLTMFSIRSNIMSTFKHIPIIRHSILNLWSMEYLGVC